VLTATICEDQRDLLYFGKFFGQMIAFTIIAINIVLKTVIIKLVTWIKEDTNSAQLASITNGVFIA